VELADSLRAEMAGSMGRRICFLACDGDFCANLWLDGRWWHALAIFGGALLIRWWTEYDEPGSGLPTSDARDC